MLYVSIFVELLRSRPSLAVWLAALAQGLLWLLVPSLFYAGPPGDLPSVVAVGHEFHRTAVTFTDSYQPAWVFRGRDVPTVRDGAVHSGVHASYLHTHPAGRPHAITRFVAAAATSRLAG